MDNMYRLRSLVNELHFVMEHHIPEPDVDSEQMKRFIRQYKEELTSDIFKGKNLLERNYEEGLTTNAIEQEGFVRGLMYALDSFDYYFSKK